jgi:hypothetical protein
VQIINDVPKLKVGIMLGVIVTLNEVVVAHKPTVGVNVYVAEAWLLTVAGLHVPVIPSSEVRGNVGAVLSSQMVSEVPKLKVGVTFGFTVTVNVAGTAHCPDVGVNV